jgi:hypothetical protein
VGSASTLAHRRSHFESDEGLLWLLPLLLELLRIPVEEPGGEPQAQELSEEHSAERSVAWLEELLGQRPEGRMGLLISWGGPQVWETLWKQRQIAVCEQTHSSLRGALPAEGR